jgi:hypothetical protein
MTIGEAGKRSIVYLDKTKHRKLSTRTAVESVLRVHLVPFFEDRGLAAVTRQDVLDLQAKMEREGVGPKSIRN